MTDPYILLGVPPDADDAAIRAAYLVALRECPPERDAQRFEQLRAAYEAIASAPARLDHELFDTTVPTAADVLQAIAATWQPALPTESHLLQVLGGSRDA